MKNLKLITALMLTLFVGKVFSEEAYLPANILMLDSKFTHHVILVDKSTHQIHLYENQDSIPRLVKTYSAATGKFRGNKFVEGDHKTPEGIYIMDNFLSQQELLRRHGKAGEIYGSGAFPMNYPNFMDRRFRKTGSGIWLHSTDDDNRISKGLDSRGCVVVKNQDLKDISQYIELEKTPIIVVQDVYHLSKTSWEKSRRELNQAVQKWITAWQNKDFNTYISSYDKDHFYDRSKGSYESYKNYKKAVFSRPDRPEIKMDFISILATTEYAVVQLQQDYRSSVINDVGKKTLYMKKDSNYDWKIVGELWEKADNGHVAFTPSKRFFKD